MTYENGQTVTRLSTIEGGEIFTSDGQLGGVVGLYMPHSQL